MIYNPIFEEEIESKHNLKDLKKDIEKRARSEYIRRTFNRVFRLFQGKSVSTLAAETIQEE